MARQIVLDVPVLRLWAVRDLLLGLADRHPAIITPRWSTAAMAEFAAGDPDAADDAGMMVLSFPESEVAGVVPDVELDLVDRRDADLVAAAVIAGALVVATLSPQRLGPAEVGHLGITAMHPDTLLMELLANDPWKVLHSTVTYAHVLREVGLPLEEVLSRLEADVPGFVAIIRAQIGALATNQPAAVFAATHEPVVLDGPDDEWFCIACDPCPCLDHDHPDASHLTLWETSVLCLPADECTFVGVTATGDHWTLVWRRPDDASLLEMERGMRESGLRPHVVRYTADLGPAVDYWKRWAARP